MKHPLQACTIAMMLFCLLFTHTWKAQAQQLAAADPGFQLEQQDDQLISLQEALKKLEDELQISINYNYPTVINKFVKAEQLKKLGPDVEKITFIYSETFATPV